MGKEIITYTDGSSLGNPGPGGWGFVMLLNDEEVIRSGGFRYTTNSRMELMAVLEVLKFAEENELDNLNIHTDSDYVKRAVNENWLKGWIKRGWKKSNKKPVKNADLWKKINSLLQQINTKFTKVPAHSGVEYNEMCDTAAKEAAEQDNLPSDNFYEAENSGEDTSLFTEPADNKLRLSYVNKNDSTYIKVKHKGSTILIPKVQLMEFLE